MPEVLDLRQFRCAQLEGLLTAETEEWARVLDWDYTSSALLIRQYIDARILPGYVLVERGAGRTVPLGYGFFIYEARKGMIGNLFIHPAHRLPGHVNELALLRHMIETLQATPGLRRIEAQLMPFRPTVLAPAFREQGFDSFRRVFLRLPLADAAAAAPPAGEVSHYRGLRLEPWGGASYEEAAQLILDAYHGHVDSRINDQYRSFAGAVRFMHNIAHYPGCGAFDPAASFIARSLPRAGLEGMVLASRVRRDVAHLTQICVLPTMRRQGLGRALIDRSLAALRRQGLRAATLTVTSENAAALNLYRQLGFATLTEFDAYVWEAPAAASGSAA